MREELLAILEAGPQRTEQLVELLGVERSTLLRELAAMRTDGLVRRMGTGKKWALADYHPKPGRKPGTSRAAELTSTREPLRPRPPLRQPDDVRRIAQERQRTVVVPENDRGSFWVGLDRDQLREAIARNWSQMSNSRQARTVDPNVRGL